MHDEVEIRRVADVTIGLFDRVAEDVFDAPIEPGRLRRFLGDDRHLMVVAVRGDQIIGQARGIVHLSPDQPDELYLDNFGVTPAFQRRGVARRLLDELLAWGRERGCAYAWLGTEPENQAARALYAASGARETAIVMFEYDPL